MNHLAGPPAEFRFALEIKRAATGQTETIELIGKVNDNGGDTLDGSAERGDGRGNGADRDERQA